MTHDNVSSDIKEHIDKKKLSALHCSDKENYVDSYLDFYDSLYK
jgi:hypothetical protein